MAKPCFYFPQLSEVYGAGEVVELPPSEAAHAQQSRRLTVGSEILLLDGNGTLADAEIVEISRRKVIIELAEITPIKRVAPE